MGYLFITANIPSILLFSFLFFSLSFSFPSFVPLFFLVYILILSAFSRAECLTHMGLKPREICYGFNLLLFLEVDVASCLPLLPKSRMSSSVSSPSLKKSQQEEILAKFNNLRNEQRNLAAKLSELQMDLNEHKYGRWNKRDLLGHLFHFSLSDWSLRPLKMSIPTESVSE